MAESLQNELGNLRFQGTFRSYQERILKQSECSFKDNKLHIVAAPGSGKTILGLEVLCRLACPALILVPTVTVREQWKERFLMCFMKPEEQTAWEKNWSESLEDIKTVTCVTYQALYQYFRTDTVKLLANRLKNQKTGTICLDEAHHLQREWWKALEELTGLMKNVKLVALTATPPYDAKDQEWRRYAGLCGEIDEEIFTPELVQEGSLCPHQDFVYLCVPEKGEEKRLCEIRRQSEEALEEILQNPVLKKEIQAHPGVADPLSYAEIFLENPGYLTALLIYLKHHGIKSNKLKKLTGRKAMLPSMNVYWMSRLLYGILWVDKDSYGEEFREDIKRLLEKRHFLHGNRLYFDRAEEQDKVLKHSSGRLRAMEEIAEAECENRKEELRLLILCDHVKKGYLDLVGDCGKPVEDIGAVPVFELMRRKFEGKTAVKAAMLAGSCAILPTEAAAAGGLKGKPLTEKYEWIEVDDRNRKKITAEVTTLFGEGYFRILTGTAALLGEGWDAPFVNCLIIASAAASYVQSNQMRGRALRIDRRQPEKVATIWHLAAVEPENCADNREYEAVSKRFQAFLGVESLGTGICNGIGRLSLLQKPFTKSRVEHINAAMLLAAKDTNYIREQWKQAEYDNESFSHIREETEIPRAAIPKNFRYYNALAAAVLGGLGTFITLSERFVIPLLKYFINHESFSLKLYQLLILVLSAGIGTYGIRIMRKLTPQGRISEVAAGLWDTLIDKGELAENTQITVSEQSRYTVDAALENASVREKDYYAGCICEIYGPIENPRYLLKEKLLPGKYEYYNVPEALGRTKKDAELFCANLKRHHQSFSLVYTRTPEGRKELLKARMRSSGNCCRNDVSRKKSVKTKWE